MNYIDTIPQHIRTECEIVLFIATVLLVIWSFIQVNYSLKEQKLDSIDKITAAIGYIVFYMAGIVIATSFTLCFGLIMFLVILIVYSK
jgi:hypothetical protein